MPATFTAPLMWASVYFFAGCASRSTISALASKLLRFDVPKLLSQGEVRPQKTRECEHGEQSRQSIDVPPRFGIRVVSRVCVTYNRAFPYLHGHFSTFTLTGKQLGNGAQ